MELFAPRVAPLSRALAREGFRVAHPLGPQVEAQMHPKTVQEQKKNYFFGVRFSNGVFNDFRCPPAPPGTLKIKQNHKSVVQKRRSHHFRKSRSGEGFGPPFWRGFGSLFGDICGQKSKKTDPEKTTKKRSPKVTRECGKVMQVYAVATSRGGGSLQSSPRPPGPGRKHPMTTPLRALRARWRIII